MFATLLAMTLGVTSDEELVRRFGSGDRSAFSELVRRYQSRVYSLCFRWLRDPAKAEEVAQDVFIALYKSLADFRGESKLSTWIFRVATNHCKNRLVYGNRRREDRHESIDAPVGGDDDGPVKQYAIDAPGPDASINRAEASKLLQAALDALDEDQREIVLLRDVDDLSYEEIAELLQLPKGTVKSRLHRARAELARRLSRKVGLEDVV
ncbi:MAG: sigma-70 family RNA polymerase sigma factor [Deltaproteobacteria bacterium]|jgi:RNA polymerase sigma-70 factor (ECF subfamily)|nr:sigma-70 family RNA polymerase sigma factor [Deltaproteobacteria bacterium]MBK9370570.1 sigma-70 family RNA polymerase sigma factor [Deltaproteobacteria bacterium]MBK9647390.1 sigma-70 family RNA polymerase sigma factor [Deltaproteobacteria bacterium]